MFWNRVINKGLGKCLIAIFSILICIVVFSPGCGKKAPPVPPGQAMPPAVNDLSSSIDEDMLKLAWTIPDENRKIASDLGVQGNPGKGLQVYL